MFQVMKISKIGYGIQKLILIIIQLIETYVIITEEPKRGKEDNGDTNYCEDNDPTTTCTTQKGNSIDEKKITIGLTFNKLTSSDVSNNPQRTGFRYISAMNQSTTFQKIKEFLSETYKRYKWCHWCIWINKY